MSYLDILEVKGHVHFSKLQLPGKEPSPNFEMRILCPLSSWRVFV